MSVKKYTFKCGHTADEPKIIEYVARGRFCPHCFDVSKDHTSQYKTRIEKVEFTCENCGALQVRTSGSISVFLCFSCRQKQIAEQAQQKRFEKQEKVLQEQKKQEADRLQKEQEIKAQLDFIEAENKDLKAKIAEYEQAARETADKKETEKGREIGKDGKERTTKRKVTAKCPKCHVVYTLYTSEVFNTKKTNWKYCINCMPFASKIAQDEVDISL